jgi:hypothetical protein
MEEEAWNEMSRACAECDGVYLGCSSVTNGAVWDNEQLMNEGAAVEESSETDRAGL